MLGSVVTRGLIMALGYLYPAYECFKAAERGRPDPEQLRFWAQFWMIMAVVTVMERFADLFIAWLPMYSEAKLAFIIYLWHDKTKGTTYIYQTFFRPFVIKHEPEIDRHLNEFKTRAGDTMMYYWVRGCSAAREAVKELLIYAAQAGSRQSAAFQGRQQPSVQPPTRMTIEELPEDYEEFEKVDQPQRSPVRPAESSGRATRRHRTHQ